MRYIPIFSTIFLFCFVSFAAAKIVFMSGWEIYKMDDDGGKVQRLTFNDVYDGLPRWAPDGNSIAFERQQPRETNEQNLDIILINLDGTQERQLTTYTGLDTNHSWSADSRYLAFSSTRSGDRWSIHIIDIETREVRELLRTIKDQGTGSASWSPDGKRIAYIVTKRNPFQEAIFTVNPNGQNPRQFTKYADSILYSIDWSPDGELLLYCEDIRDHNGLLKNRIAIHNATSGLFLRELEMPPLHKWFINGAGWMGTQHVLITATENYSRPDGGQSDIFKYTLATDEIINLTNSPRDNEGAADWITDSALAVTPAGKLTVRWGELKRNP